MKEGIKQLAGLALIILLLIKGLTPLLPSFSAIFDDTVSELQSAPEQEKQKESSRFAEKSPVEEFFEKMQFDHEDMYAFISSDKNIIHSAHSLPYVHLDILTPPPDMI
jgi:hypothetical protein